ncbi:class I SAM-dependent methyltransferase [Blastopirellula sp. JC732]|uniref:Class I SAM-dependent methyltransferase n=1 Tax=Blastopirellula sediminis TaxID=2894196 RepID=A0A9X1MPZ1_9BACT|nr:class I SAM-dependent methyltransferase [Blastopirellula sediminis]MCC9606100.1 class I SAM-dependent methyltransferase [Blastopirellula sediminis]MCC9630601.1 class I SAM-dependent methyltransferase [Blastopirellula sediminis]
MERQIGDEHEGARVTAKESIQLTQERETLLITLYGKAEESRLSDSLLQDHHAVGVIERLDYDFPKLRVTRDGMISVAIRSKTLDDWTRDFLVRHPDATILHLGCGLDSRILRVDPSEEVAWFEVDFPEVIALRQRIFAEREGCRVIGASILDSDWLDAAPRDRPTLVVAEGVLPYLPAAAVPELFRQITEYFEQGEIAFDAYSRLGVKTLNFLPSIQATGARLRWGLGDSRSLESQVPRLSLVAEESGLDPRQMTRISWPMRTLANLTQLAPPLRRFGRLLRYRFG